MEITSVITQELELLLADMDGAQVSRDEVHNLMTSVPSMRALSESNEAAIRAVENQWHKLFITWQSILGQLKVRQKQLENQSFFGSLFRKKKTPRAPQTKAERQSADLNARTQA